MPLIDTLALKTGLIDGGMPEPQAAAIVQALADADTTQLAAKADVEVLRWDIKMLRWMGGVILTLQVLVTWVALAAVFCGTGSRLTARIAVFE